MTSRFAREIIFSASIIAILLCPFVGMLNSTVSKDESVALKGDRSLLKLDVEQASRSLRDWPTLQSHCGFPMMHWIRSLEEMRIDEPPSPRTYFQGDVLVYDGPLDQRNPRMVYDEIEKKLWAVFTHHNSTDDIYVANSDDLGQTWTTYAIASNQSYNESNPAIAMSGATIMIVYEQDRMGGEQQIDFIRSQDHGMNWNGFHMDWNWTNQPGHLQLEDFNNPDISISQVDWFHWTADAFGVRNNTRTVAFMWTEDDGDNWWMVYWTATWHMGEDFEHPVIMENMADNYMHMAYQH